MFKRLLEVWRKGLMGEMFKGFLQMLDDTHWMFGEVTAILFDARKPEEVAEELYRRDIAVNQAERRVRKQILEHMTMRPSKDVIECLILMSTSKDAERLGDYCKNLFEVAQMLRGPIPPTDPHHAEFKGLCQELDQSFSTTREAFAKSDDRLARAIITREVELSDVCEGMIRGLCNEDLSPRKAVCYALLARYLKRVDAHLGNIASSVVMPFHKIDYFDEKWGRPYTPPRETPSV